MSVTNATAPTSAPQLVAGDARSPTAMSAIDFTAALGCRKAAEQIADEIAWDWWVANSWTTYHESGGISTRMATPEELERRAATKAQVERELADLPKSLRETVIRFGDGEIDFKPIDIGGKNRNGLMRCLEHIDIGIRYNTRSASIEAAHGVTVWQPLGFAPPHLFVKLSDFAMATAKQERIAATWHPFDGRLQDYIRELLPRQFFYKVKGKADETRDEPLVFGKDKWNEALGAISYATEADPLVEWLETLPAWDGTPRLGRWLSEVFQLEPGDGNSQLAAWSGQFIFLGVVWRSFRPGTKLDEMPVLNGPGGIGKSTALAHIFPENTRSKYFTDGLKVAGDAKERVEATQGRALVEASEMSGVTRADFDDVNAYLAATDDGSIRLAYRRDPEPTPRRFVIVGTSHRPTFLPNDDNLRRFVPVYLRAGSFNSAEGVRSYLDHRRDQLWAEAIHLYHRGVEARLPDSLKTMQRAATTRARSSDTIMEDAIEGWTSATNGLRVAFTLARVSRWDRARRRRFAHEAGKARRVPPHCHPTLTRLPS